MNNLMRVVRAPHTVSAPSVTICAELCVFLRLKSRRCDQHMILNRRSILCKTLTVDGLRFNLDSFYFLIITPPSFSCLPPLWEVVTAPPPWKIITEINSMQRK